MTIEADPNRGDAHYNTFYQTGGWKYSFWREYWWHRRQIVKRFHLQRGLKMLEVGCGAGFHTHLFNKMGFDCTGVDRSEEGIAWAREHYPDWNYRCADVFDMPLPRGHFDVILARGLSLYHYDLMGRKALHTTATLLRYLKPTGLLVMTIATDLSGKQDDEKIWQNTLDDYDRHFAFFDRRYTVDWHKGMAICGIWNDEATVGDIITTQRQAGRELELAEAEATAEAVLSF